MNKNSSFKTSLLARSLGVSALVLFALGVGIFATTQLTGPSQAQADPADASPVARIQKAKVLKVCSDAGFVPFQMRTSDGTWQGYDVDMMQAFSTSLNVKLEMIQVNFDGIIPALMAGKCDIIASGMTVTPDRAKAVSFSNPTFINTLSVATDAGENAKKYTGGLVALDKSGVKIAVKTGYTSDLYLQKNLKHAQVLRFDNDADLITAVKQGRAQALMTDTTFLNSFEEKHPHSLAVLQTLPTQENFAVATKKQDIALVQNFNTFFASWKQTPQYQKLYQSYFPLSQTP